MGSHRLIKKRAFGFFLLLVLGTICSLVPFGMRIMAASNPPVGTKWEQTVQLNSGAPGEVNVTWSASIESANSQTVSLRYTFFGEMGFATDQVCNNPSPIPIPWTRLTLRGTWSGGAKSTQPMFADESLSTSKLNYQTPTFVNCWPMQNPPTIYPNAVSYVKYSDYRFSAIQSGIPTEYFSKLSTVVLTVTTNASPGDVTNFAGATITIPVIAVDAVTTTTKPATSTTMAGASTTTVENSTEATTSTLVGVDTGITIPTEDIATDGGAGPNDSDIGAGVLAVDVAYDIETETPVQEEKRKEGTANSLVATAAILFSSLAAAAPALGAVSAAGAIGGLVGVTTSRSFSGGELLPQVPKPSATAVVASKSRLLNKLDDLPEPMASENDVLENDFVTPSTRRAVQGGTPDVGIAQVGAVFAAVIFFLQYVSRIRVLRPGLRRWAEIALVSPTLAAATPILIVLSSALLAVLRSYDIIGSTVALLGLFVLSILAPVLSVFIALGWCVGRVLSAPASFVISTLEGVALLPLVLFMPMMQRNLLGPRSRSRQWEHTFALVLAPCVAALAYRNWLTHFSDITGSLCRMANPLSGTCGSRLLGTNTELEALIVGIVMAVLVMFVAFVAVQYSDGDGRPEIMFGRFVQLERPIQILRREYVDLATVELGEPSQWGRLWRYGLSGLLSIFLLFEVLGMRSIVVVLVFLLVVVLTRRFPRPLKSREIHPIVKTVPMAIFGLLLGAIAVSPSRVFIALTIVAILTATASLVRTRTLWDS